MAMDVRADSERQRARDRPLRDRILSAVNACVCVEHCLP